MKKSESITTGDALGSKKQSVTLSLFSKEIYIYTHIHTFVIKRTMQMFMSAIAHSTSYELESRAKFELVVLQFV